MLLQRAEQRAVFGNDLRGGRGIPAVEPVMHLAEPALAGKQVQIVLYARAVLRRAERHIDRRNDRLVLRVLRQHIKHDIVAVEHRIAVKIICRGGLDHNPLLSEHEFVDIAVKRHVRAAQHVDGVRVYGHAQRYPGVDVVGDVRPVYHKLPLVRAGVDHGRDAFKARYIRQGQLLVCVAVSVCVYAVFNIVYAVDPVMDLQIAVILSVPRNNARKRALGNDAVLPRERKYVLYRHVIQYDPARAAGDRPLLRGLHPDDAGNKRRRPERKGKLLHLVGLDAEIVLLEYAVYKILLRLPLERDLDLLVHQQVRPVLGDFLAHIQRVPFALQRAMSVSDPVPMEAFHVSGVPAFPFVYLAVEIRIYRSVAQFPEFVDYRHAITPIRRLIGSSPYLKLSIRWFFSSG